MKNPKQPYLNGTQHTQTYQYAVNALLVGKAPPVYSSGDKFFYVNRWTTRIFLSHLRDWAKRHKKIIPTRSTVQSWVQKTNNEVCPKPYIQIATTPSRLPSSLAQALTGGAYHEALHGVYTHVQDLKTDEMYDLVVPRWGLVEDWTIYLQMLLEWSNVVEDIKIENRGVERFPGIYTKLTYLNDFILDKEHENDNEALKSDQDLSADPLTIITRTFRDTGLGYTTSTQKEAFERYAQINQEGVNFVLGVGEAKGPLTDILAEAKALAEDDYLGSIRLALDIVIALEREGLTDPKKMQEEQEKQVRECGVVVCPACQAPAKDLRVRYTITGPVIVCTVCGHQEKVKIPQEDETSNQGTPIQIEEPPKEPDEGEGGGEIEDGGEGEPSSEDQKTARKMKEQLTQGQKPKTLDLSQTFEEAVRDAVQDQIQKEGGVLEGEEVWRPRSLDQDKIMNITQEDEHKRKKRIYQRKVDSGFRGVKSQTHYLVMRLRQKFHAMGGRRVLHGQRKGKHLSGRTLVDTFLSIQSGEVPKKAYRETTPARNDEACVSIVVDESGSMSNLLEYLVPLIYLLASPFESVGAKVQIVGFQAAYRTANAHDMHTDKYHRSHNMNYHVFKNFEDELKRTGWSLGALSARGSTPMGDGIEFGMRSLTNRREKHKFLFVVTDGCPDNKRVVRRQLRLAKEQHDIHVVGIGFGGGCLYVEDLFPDSIWAETIQELPLPILEKVTNLILKKR